MAAFIDIDIFANRTDADARALTYTSGPARRRNVQVIEADRVLVHDSRSGGQRVFDSGGGTFFVVKSEAS